MPPPSQFSLEKYILSLFFLRTDLWYDSWSCMMELKDLYVPDSQLTCQGAFTEYIIEGLNSIKGLQANWNNYTTQHFQVRKIKKIPWFLFSFKGKCLSYVMLLGISWCFPEQDNRVRAQLNLLASDNHKPCGSWILSEINTSLEGSLSGSAAEAFLELMISNGVSVFALVKTLLSRE